MQLKLHKNVSLTKILGKNKHKHETKANTTQQTNKTQQINKHSVLLPLHKLSLFLIIIAIF